MCRFFYCGKIDLGNLQGPEIFKLLIAVDELDIQPLISCIQEYLIKYNMFSRALSSRIII